jgi:hypothetical protein
MKDDFKNALSKLREAFKSDGRISWSESNINLSSKFDDLIFDRAGGACPVQATGTYKGEPFYFRYRWGYASLGLGNEPVSNPDIEYELQYGDGMDGFLSLGEFHDIFTKLLQFIIRKKVGKEYGN